MSDKWIPVIIVTIGFTVFFGFPWLVAAFVHNVDMAIEWYQSLAR